MNFASEISIAFILDVLLGDPAWFPHPVKGIGKLIEIFERPTRKLFFSERLAGAVTGAAVVGLAFSAVYWSVKAAGLAGEVPESIVRTAWLYMGISSRGLSDSAYAVYVALSKGDIERARKKVAMIVGRDTARLDEGGVSRAAVESVAENTVDGIISPIFFALIGGAPLMWAFKAASTCDSMIGHKDERYARFGTFSARLDDAANYIPARLCYILFPFACIFTGLDFRSCAKIAARDGGNHDSPNAGIPEAAAAGALNVRLGGAVSYDGEEHVKKPFGAEFAEPRSTHIKQAIILMWMVSFITLGIAALLSLRIRIFM